jgi:hypothetical protein
MLVEGSFDPFNAARMRHVDHVPFLQSSVVSGQYIFFLVTWKTKTLQMIHSVILVSPSLGKPAVLMGIQGNRAVSPIRVIPSKDMTAAIRKKRGTTTSNVRWIVPNMDQFLLNDG